MSVAARIWAFLFPRYETFVPLSKDEQHWLKDYPTGRVPFRWRGFSAGGYDSSVALTTTGLKLTTEQANFGKVIVAAVIGGIAILSLLITLSGDAEAAYSTIIFIPMGLFLFVGLRVCGRLAHLQDLGRMKADVLQHLQARSNE